MRRYLLVLVTIAVVLSLALVGCVGKPQPQPEPENSKPSVTLNSPSNGATLDATTTVTLKWTGADADNDDLSYTVFLKKISDANWTEAATLTKKPGPAEATVTVQPGNTYLWQVEVTDGKDSFKSDVWSFTIEAEVTPEPTPSNQPPVLELISPEDNSSFKAYVGKVELVWKATDPDGDEIIYNLFINNVHEKTFSASSGDTVTYHLNVESGKKYTWKVIASDGKSSVSKQASFSVNPEPELKPTSGEKYTCGATVTLDWGDWVKELDFTPKSYTINISRACECEGEELSKESTDTTSTSYKFKPQKCGVYYWSVEACDPDKTKESPKGMFCVLPKLLVTIGPEDDEDLVVKFVVNPLDPATSLVVPLSALASPTIITIEPTGCTSCDCENMTWKIKEVTLGKATPTNLNLSEGALWILPSATNCVSPNASVTSICSSYLGETVMKIEVDLFKGTACCPGCCEVKTTIDLTLGEIDFGLIRCDTCANCTCGYLYFEVPKGLEPEITFCATITISNGEHTKFEIPADSVIEPDPIIDSDEKEIWYICLDSYKEGVLGIEKGKVYTVDFGKKGYTAFRNSNDVYFLYPCDGPKFEIEAK